MNRIDAIFSPKSIAVIGASSIPGKVGHDIFQNLLKGGFQGVLFPVNPKARSILSVKAYANVLDIPDEVDLAIITLPPKVIMETTLDECIRKNVKALVVVSAGFREIGLEGRKMEDELAQKCREASIRVVGPNCLGVINPKSDVRMNASFSTRMPEEGNISFISQSGALCTSVLDFAADRDFGFSKFISIGNKADVDESDLLQYLHDDPDTDVIMIYLEELRDGPKFIRAVKEITTGEHPTPVLVIKSGRTADGAKAAASHTGALAGSEAVYDAIFQQTGIIRASTIDELFDFANAFTFKKSRSVLGKMVRKMPMGRDIAIITNAGGPGILATDMVGSAGLKSAKLSTETVDELKKYLPAVANFHNPIDVIGDADAVRYEHALSVALNANEVHAAVVILTPQSMSDVLGTAEAIARVARKSSKPVLCCFMGVEDVSPGVKYLQHNGYPVYRFPENAVKSLAAMYYFYQWQTRKRLPQLTLTHDPKTATDIIVDCLAKGQTYLGELEGLAILNAYGFNTLTTTLATTADEAVKIADKIGYPVVMKIVSPQIIHKSDANGVQVGLETSEEVADVFTAIVKNAQAYNAKADIAGVLVQQMAPKGEEVILGMNRYKGFGPLVMFGLGGVFVELFKDVVFRLAPFGRNEARRMIQGIKGYKIFTGFRNKPKGDLDSVERMLVNLSALVTEHPEIKELDINPLLVHPEGKGTTVVDCRIILEKP